MAPDLIKIETRQRDASAIDGLMREEGQSVKEKQAFLDGYHFTG
jgi:hypothetical protein